MRSLGHEIRTLSSGEVAKQLLGRERIAVLIAELKHNGLDLLRAVKMRSRGTRVIFVSADASASEYKRAISEGAVDVLVKPFTQDDLQDALRRAFDTGDGAKSIIHKLNLTDLLQIMHMGMRSVTVKVSPGEGRIYMQRGQIIHSTHYRLSGVDALRSMLALEASSIETGAAAETEQTIDGNFEMLLLDLMREIDEAKRLEPDVFIEDIEEIEELEELEPISDEAETAVVRLDQVVSAPLRSEPSFAASLFLAMAVAWLFITVVGMNRVDLPKIDRLQSSLVQVSK